MVAEDFLLNRLALEHLLVEKFELDQKMIIFVKNGKEAVTEIERLAKQNDEKLSLILLDY